ncbi:hypothetical protein GY45DRAFT_519109 [Cubamyces sp. BRFM 1775]|nr:hypothetical protein GY45DRAFT_519109 [Cubamyces sp. BRFM 1775]
MAAVRAVRSDSESEDGGESDGENDGGDGGRRQVIIDTYIVFRFAVCRAKRVDRWRRQVAKAGRRRASSRSRARGGPMSRTRVACRSERRARVSLCIVSGLGVRTNAPRR